MTVTLPTSLPSTPIIGGRWNDSGSSGQSLVVLSPAVALASGAEWYLQGVIGGGTPVDMVASDWNGPVNATDGYGNQVLVFTVNAINGVTIDRYTQYRYTVGQRDPANHATWVHTPVSGTAYPTNGWNSGTVISPKLQVLQSNLSSPQVSLVWNAVSGVDFSKKYFVQYAVGTIAPAGYTSNPDAAPDSFTANGTSEAAAYATYGITGFYPLTETADTSIPITLADSNPAHWTWFRVMAYSALWGYTGVFQGGASTTQWVGVRNDTAKFPAVTAPTGSVVVGEPTTSTNSTTSGPGSIANPVKASDLTVETNLPMLSHGFGGIAHQPAMSRVRWRDGMLVLNADQTVDKSLTSRRWGFRFHYNPSTWSQDAAIAQDIDLTTYAQTGGNLMLPTAFSHINLTIYLNRIMELSVDVAPDDPLGIAKRAHQLTAGDFFLGTGDGAPQASIDPVGLAGSYFDWVANTPLPLTKGYSSPADKITEVLKKGTLADLEYLYRVANGDPTAVSDRDGTTADIGMLGMTVMDLYLGPNIKYAVRIAGMNAQHMMFSSRMIPTFTEVQLSMIRGITKNDLGKDSLSKLNTQWPTTGAPS